MHKPGLNSKNNVDIRITVPFLVLDKLEKQP